MAWYQRQGRGILTPSEAKIEAPDGLWTKCPGCNKAIHARELRENSYVCPHCGYHYPIGSREYFQLLFDTYKELFAELAPADPLEFIDSKPYKHRISDTQKKTHLKDAVRCAEGEIGPYTVALACMDFGFIGGSMGSVVGEKIKRLILHAAEKKYPLVIISRSGGARMMEGSLSLLQMAKTAAALTVYQKVGLPYFSLLTNPTTGGVTASFAMLGDLNLAEPGALIGFAGPRVIQQATGKELPPGFQQAEFQQEHGFVDLIVDRRELKKTLLRLWELFI